ncbi:hypothetical protein NLX83_29955 [Allokutzneria sp. A3M-2-11 16]|uniref:hypothetical protein n=1 Tax=Allokutzneria sp. A3M-2-11 16 TaxID=2962043 RepID=UPI0020B8BD33|nr:hypothetical protein [Allokutzneria sp. A3M-2-11 16]MCP3803503.1 hypothetical protein [Allokutzneria sp. A3M-2-11 16]
MKRSVVLFLPALMLPALVAAAGMASAAPVEPGPRPAVTAEVAQWTLYPHGAWPSYEGCALAGNNGIAAGRWSEFYCEAFSLGWRLWYR